MWLSGQEGCRGENVGLSGTDGLYIVNTFIPMITADNLIIGFELLEI